MAIPIAPEKLFSNSAALKHLMASSTAWLTTLELPYLKETIFLNSFHVSSPIAMVVLMTFMGLRFAI